MAAIKITIGGALDRSVHDSFAQYRKLAQDAGIAADRALGRRRGGGGGGGGGSQNPELIAARAIHAEQSRLNRDIFRQQVQAARAAHNEDKRLSRARAAERIQNLREEARQHLAANRLVEATAAREHSAALARRYFGTRDREIDRLATRTSHRAVRFMFPRPEGALGYAQRTGNELMRGLGVDMSMGGGISRAKEREAAAVALSNQGWIPGQGKFEDRISAESLRGTAGGVASKYKMDETGILAGMSKFTDVTGDLATAQKSIESIALLSRATGTAIEDAASAAADMSMQLGNIPDKAVVLEKLMGVAAMGGKQGAVEMKDLAKYVPQIAALAGTMTGDRAGNIGKLLAITQTARQYGGAGNAAIATTATAGLINTLQTPSRVKEFEAHFKKYTGGKSSVYDKQGKARAIDDILIDSIKSAGTGQYRQVEFKKMWANVKGGKAAQGFMTLYDEAEAKKKGTGEAAVRGQFAKFTAGITPEEQKQLAGATLNTKEAKAQDFQNKWDRVTAQLADRLVPALEKLEGPALRLASLFTGFVSWTTDNLGKAIALAFSIAIARAHIESLFRGAIDKSITKAYGGGGVGAAGMPTGGGIGVGGVMSALALGAATFTITDATLNILGQVRQKESERASQGLGQQWDEYMQKRREIVAGGGTAEEKKTKLEELAKHTSANVALTQESQSGIMSKLPDWFRGVFDSATAMQVDEGAKKFQEQIAKDMADSARLLRSAATELNSAAKSKPEVDPSGRSGNGK